MARRNGWMKGGRVPSDVSPLTTLPLGVPSFPGSSTRTTHWSLPQLGCCLSWPPLGTSLLCSTSRRTRWYALRSGQSVSLQERVYGGGFAPTFIPTFPETVQSPSSRDSFLPSRPEGVDLPLQVELIPASCLHLQAQLKLNNTNDTLIDNGTYTRHHSFLVRVRMHVLHVSAVGFHHFPYTFERCTASVIPLPTDIMNEIPTGPVEKSLLVIWRVLNYFNNLRIMILDVNTAKALWVGVSTFYLTDSKNVNTSPYENDYWLGMNIRTSDSKRRERNQIIFLFIKA